MSVRRPAGGRDPAVPEPPVAGWARAVAGLYRAARRRRVARQPLAGLSGPVRRYAGLVVVLAGFSAVPTYLAVRAASGAVSRYGALPATSAPVIGTPPSRPVVVVPGAPAAGSPAPTKPVPQPGPPADPPANSRWVWQPAGDSWRWQPPG